MARGLDRNQLKILAAAAMLLDHIGMMFVPVSQPLGCLLRVVGRLTAPIMCFFIAEGYRHTASGKRYALRLLVFALLSQPAYAYAHGEADSANLNVLWSLLAGFLMLQCVEDTERPAALRWTLCALLLAFSALADWGVAAPLWIVLFYVNRENPRARTAGFCLVAAGVVLYASLASAQTAHWYGALWQLGLFLFVPVPYLYNGQRGSGSAFSKWFFYVFYPAHLALLGLLRRLF